MHPLFMAVAVVALLMFPVSALAADQAAGSRTLAYTPRSADATRAWQRECRRKLAELMMGGGLPQRSPLTARVLRTEVVPAAPYVLQEITIQSLPDRRAHLWVAAPRDGRAKRPCVLAIHGHGGSGEQVVRGQGLYWYGKALAEMGYVVIAPDVGSHDLQYPNWTLMGERVWDCIRALDYAETRPDVDRRRMAVCGLSLGGETTMYVAAMDTRIKAVCSSGWLTTVANMRNGHCPCYDFPGLADHFDFADIFGCIAPRPLVCEIGEQERAPGGFPVSIARPAFAEILQVYQAFGAQSSARLMIHPGGHVFVGTEFWPILRGTIGVPPPYRPVKGTDAECRRRGVIHARAMERAVGVLRGWWSLRDPATGLLPRRVNERVWAPNDNAADLMPFLFLTDYFTGGTHSSALRQMLSDEARLTNRVGVLPDWFSLDTRNFVYASPDIQRLIFCAAEYCKDGLMPMTEAMGRGPWFDRMCALMDAVIESAPVTSDYGLLPAPDTEVNGDVLQVLGRLYSLTREQRYLDHLLRITDAYCFEVIPRNGGIPAYRWDFARHAPAQDTFSLNDHGNEIVLGLVEAYIAAKTYRPERAERYRAPLRLMLQRLLDRCRNADGLWVGAVKASTASVTSPSTPDTWGYALSGVLAFARAESLPDVEQKVVETLRALRRPRYLTWVGADSYADSIEGALILQNRLHRSEVDDWLTVVTPIFFAYQQPSGIVEGWYGDGNFARTALMLALYYSQGVHCVPWNEGLECGAVRTGNGVRVVLHASKEWKGRLVFDSPRHRQLLHLPWDYPRLNQWPEWFVAEPGKHYRVRVAGSPPTDYTGEALAQGLELSLQPGRPVAVAVTELSPANQQLRGEQTPRRNVE